MTYIENEYRRTDGHKRNSWKPANTKAVFFEIAAEHRKASREEIYRLYREHVASDPDCLRTDLEFRCDIYWTAWLREQEAKRRPSGNAAVTPEESRSRTAEIAAAKEDFKQRLTLMALTMPNGKELRDCIGKELTKFGGWFARLRSKVGANQKVGEVLTEQDLQAAWAKK